MQLPDILMAAANFVFIVGLLPTVYHQFKVKASTIPLTTSLPTTVALCLVLVALWMLDLWMALITDAATTVLWVIIAGQRWEYGAPGSVDIGLVIGTRLRR